MTLIEVARAAGFGKSGISLWYLHCLLIYVVPSLFTHIYFVYSYMFIHLVYFVYAYMF